MGLERGNQGGTRSRAADYSSYRSYGADAPSKYEYKNGSKFEGSGKFEIHSENGTKYESGGAKYENGKTKYTNGTNGNIKVERAEENVSPNLVSSLKKKISSVEQEMNQALQDVTGKENEKFDLIFSILIELQRRQAQLEESVRKLKGQCSPADSSGVGQQQGQQAPMEVTSPMGQQMGAFGQMPMNQQYSQQVQQVVVNADGSQTYYTPVTVVAVPQPAGQMPYAVPQMMQGSMQPMPQPMAMQYVGQGPAGDDYNPWNNGAASAADGKSAETSSQDCISQKEQDQPAD